MPKLFQINDARTRKPVPGLQFSCKTEAKAERNKLNSEGFKYYVAPGPDHVRCKR